VADVKPPKGLAARGRKFWRDVLADFELATAELELLAEACRAVDQIDALAAAVDEHGTMTKGSTGQLVVNPAIPQLNATRALLARLLAQLSLPDEDGQAIPTSGTVQRRNAAKERWAGHDKSKSVRNYRKSAKTNVVSIDGTSA
jgi:hypothetical protein